MPYKCKKKMSSYVCVFSKIQQSWIHIYYLSKENLQMKVRFKATLWFPIFVMLKVGQLFNY